MIMYVHGLDTYFWVLQVNKSSVCLEESEIVGYDDEEIYEFFADVAGDLKGQGVTWFRRQQIRSIEMFYDICLRIMTNFMFYFKLMAKPINHQRFLNAHLHDILFQLIKRTLLRYLKELPIL